MDAATEYLDIKRDLAPFRTISDAETVKTVASVDALCERANILLGTDKDGARPGLDSDTMFKKAKYYLTELQNGKFPLKGKFCEPGNVFVDHSFIEKDGIMHVFYIRGTIGYNWSEKPMDTIGHATSCDLINWEYHFPAVTATKNECMNCNIWAPAVVERNGKYYMFFTGVNRSVSQSICLAVSDDLYSWDLIENNPVYTPGSWCPWSKDKWSNCRDPFVLCDKENGKDVYYMYFCTDRYKESGGVEPANGILRSYDLKSWEEIGTFKLPSCSHAAESPFVLKHNGQYYFFYTNYGSGTYYAVSDSPCGEWKEIGPLMIEDVPPADPAWVPSCAEVICYKSKWFISKCKRLPGWEQYLELYELSWNSDGTVTVGKQIM